MPRAVASIALASGVVVVAFGIAYTAIGPREDVDDADAPVATLEPVSSGERSASGTGVRGTITTTSDDPAPDVKVTLIPLFMDEDVKPVSTRTDARGRFSFDVEVDPGSPWIAEASYDGERFPSSVLRAPRGKADPLELVVAPVTKKTKDIEITVDSLAVVGDAGGAQAVHAVTVVNRGKRAYVGGVHLPLLRGAQSIQEGTGLDRRYLSLEHGAMVSDAPVLPGAHDLTYTYVVQMSKKGLAIDREHALDTARVELLVGDGLALETSDLRDDGTVTLGPRSDERTYRRYVARSVDAGERLRARITVASGSSALRTAIPIAAVVLALLLVLFPLLRRRRPVEPATSEVQTTSTPA
jgi:hypothetical protein